MVSAEAASITSYYFNYTPVNAPNAQWTWLYGITNAGVAYGEYALAGGSVFEFTYSNGTYANISLNYLNPLGVNDFGVLVGNGYCGGITVFSGCIRQPSGALTTYPDLRFTGINNSGIIVGAQDGHAMLFSNGVAQDLGIPGESGATGINNLNQIVGWYRFGGFGSFRHGFVWQNGTYITLDSPTGYSGSYSLNTINNSGVIPSSGYVYIGGQWIELTDPWTNWLVEVWGINDLGIMVGFLGHQGIIVAPAGYSKTTYDPETNGIIGIVNSIYPSPESSSGLSSMSAMPAAFALSSQESSTVPEPSTVSVGIGLLAIAATGTLRKALRLPGKSK